MKGSTIYYNVQTRHKRENIKHAHTKPVIKGMKM